MNFHPILLTVLGFRVQNLFQLFYKPILTIDQLKLLKYDNISSGKYKTNFDINIPSIHKFNLEVAKYCYMWKESGQFSKKKYDL